MLKVINPLINVRIGIATTYGKSYYKFIKSLKNLDVPFDSILPDQINSYSGSIVFTTRKEAPKKSLKHLLFEEEVFEKHPTVLKGMILQKLDLDFEEETLVFGIDPGDRIGLSVYYYGKEIESSFFTSIDDLVAHIITILGELRSKNKLVKIGNGNMTLAKKIGIQLNLKFCSSFELEYVDERKTTMKIKNYNQRGKRNQLSAKYITQREGNRRLILPLSLIG